MKIRILRTVAILAGLAGFQNPASADISDEAAKSIVETFYEAFNPKPGIDVGAILRSVTADDWTSCGGNDACGPRDAVIAGIEGFGKAVPNLTWTIKDMIVSGDKIIVRGEGSGTPVGEFIGAPQSGKSFTAMAIDIHEIRGGKIAKTYHVEDMLGAQGQLMGK